MYKVSIYLGTDLGGNKLYLLYLHIPMNYRYYFHFMDNETEVCEVLSNLLNVIRLVRDEVQMGTKLFLSPKSTSSDT